MGERKREGERWKNLFQMPNNSVIFQPWSSNFDALEVNGKMCPKNPTSVWPSEPKNQISTLSAIQMDIKKWI